MKQSIKYRLIFTLIVLIGCAAYLSFSRTSEGFSAHSPLEKVNLGLDLKGGIHLVLRIKTQDAFEVTVNQTRDLIEADMKDQGIVFTRTGVTDGFGIEIVGVLQAQQQELQSYLGQYSLEWNYQTRSRESEVDFSLSMTSGGYKALADRTVQDAKETIQKRVDQYGVAEPTIQIYGSGDVKDQIIVELPGVEDFDRVLNLIKSTARLELKLVHRGGGGPYSSRESALQSFNNVLPPDYEILPYRNPNEIGAQTTFMVVRKAPSITGQQLKDARRTVDSFTGRSEVNFFLNAEGVRLFTRATEENVGTQLAIVLDDSIYSAPNISERISTDSANIQGSFTPEQAEDLALVLRSGALPAAIEILENRIIGPSLGRDSIRRGLMASIVGLVLVVVGMLVFYRFSGTNAIVCLFFNLLILLAVLAGFRATLTLPGIAGVILTIGMAVDANILIFERIKEELRLGKTVKSAVDAGFDRVFSTILDTNVTTLVASLFLFQFGTGPVRGFAVTLGVGLLANIFTAVFVSRTLFGMVLEGRQTKQLSI